MTEPELMETTCPIHSIGAVMALGQGLGPEGALLLSRCKGSKCAMYREIDVEGMPCISYCGLARKPFDTV